MKKIITIVVIFILLAGMLMAFGGDSNEVALAEVVTEQGVTIELPTDMEKKSDILYASDSGESVTVQAIESSPSEPISDWFEEAIVALYEQTYTDVAITSFENGKTINGNTGMVAYFTGKTTEKDDRGGAIVMLTDGKNDYIINFLYRGENAEGFFATNLETIINSITTN